MVSPAIDVKYEDVEKLIYSAIISVWRNIGGDLDEMIACSGMLFVKAVNCYKPERGKTIEAWIRKVAWDDTFSARRIDIGRQKKYAKGDVDLAAIVDRHHFNLQDLLDELSEDAINLVQLALDPIDGIKMKADGVPKMVSFCAAAKRLWGWSDEQLQEIMLEIREGLLP